MRKFTLCLLLCASVGVAAQKKKKEKFEDILQTTDISKIELFLQIAHPEDPRRTVLKPKLIALKNAAWTQGKKDAKPMASRPAVTEIPKTYVNRPNSTDAEEFKNLMAESSTAKKEKTVKLLNSLFDQDINKKEAIVLIQNNSDCNMILRIKSDKKSFNLAVPAHGENSIVIDKGNYDFESSICDAKYASKKEVKKSLMVVLNNPVINIQNRNMATGKPESITASSTPSVTN